MIDFIYNTMFRMVILSIFYIIMAFCVYAVAPNRSVVERYAIRAMQVCGVIIAIIVNVIVVIFVFTTDFYGLGAF